MIESIDALRLIIITIIRKFVTNNAVDVFLIELNELMSKVREFFGRFSDNLMSMCI